MIQENFIFGVGAGNWQVIFPKYGLDKFSDPQVNNGLTTFQRPHNDFLWVLSEMGAIGLIAYIAIFIIITRYLFKLIKHHKSGNWNYLYTLFIATIAGYCCIMLLDFPLERIEHQILLYLVFSIITAQFYKAFPLTKKINQPTFKSLVPIFIFGTILFSFLVSFKRFSGEVHSNKLYHFKQKNNWLKVIKESNKATNTFYSIDPMSMPLEWYKGNALYNLGKIKEAEISFEKAQSIHPYNIHILNNLASCYENLNNHKKAVKTYNKALSISSNFEEARLNLSAVYYNQKKYEMAFKTIDLCPINSTNKKYKKFLPTILASWLNELKSKQKNNLIINTPSDSKTISQVYFESKEKSIKFEEFLSKKYN
jgi:tetratricopeptide (TPR) repeat protein